MTDTKTETLRAILEAEGKDPKDTRARASSKTAQLRALAPTIVALRARRPPVSLARIAELLTDNGLDVSVDLISRVAKEKKPKARSDLRPVNNRVKRAVKPSAPETSTPPTEPTSSRPINEHAAVRRAGWKA